MSEKIRGAKTAYDLARLLLAERGIVNADQAYAACPEMPPRTVRRIFERGSDLMGSDSSLPPNIKDPVSIPEGVIHSLTEKARAAGVSLRAALSAVMRFGNAPDRVAKVLDDLKALNAKTPSRNPSGLFVFCMRTGQDIRLPDSLLDSREAEQPKHPPLGVGEWVRWNLEWMRVMSLKGLQAYLSPSADELDLYKINLDLLLHLPRRHHPAG